MSNLKDKVFAYLDSFLEKELVEVKFTRADPFGDSLVKAATAPADPESKETPGEQGAKRRAAKAELKGLASKPLKGALDVDAPISAGTVKPKASEPILSRGAHTAPPEVKGVVKPFHVEKPVGPSGAQYDRPKTPETFSTGGLINPTPMVGEAPAHIKAALGKALKKSKETETAKETKVAAGLKTTQDTAAVGRETTRAKNPEGPTGGVTVIPSSAGLTRKQRHMAKYRATRAEHNRQNVETGGLKSFDTKQQVVIPGIHGHNTGETGVTKTVTGTVDPAHTEYRNRGTVAVDVPARQHGKHTQIVPIAPGRSAPAVRADVPAGGKGYSDPTEQPHSDPGFRQPSNPNAPGVHPHVDNAVRRAEIRATKWLGFAKAKETLAGGGGRATATAAAAPHLRKGELHAEKAKKKGLEQPGNPPDPSAVASPLEPYPKKKA